MISRPRFAMDRLWNFPTRHFAVTEVYVPHGEDWKLVQFSFTALVY